MVLEQLLGQLADARFDRVRLRSSRTRQVLGITPDSRRAGPGMVFVSLPERQRQNPFQARAALERGAEAVICDPATPMPPRAACVRVADARAAFAQAAALFHDHPARRLRIFGVGGEAETRGRVAASLASLLHACGLGTAWFGSQACEAGGRRLPFGADHLDAFELQSHLAAHAKAGGKACVIEMLPSLLDGGRLGSIEFAGRVTSGLGDPAVVVPEFLSPRGSRVRLDLGGVRVVACTPLVGRAQVMALSQAAMAAFEAGVPARTIAGALPLLAPPTGFLEPVSLGQPFGVFVDAGGDAAALAVALRDARELAKGRVFLVVGPRPDASSAERRALADVAFAFADEVVVTSDNAGPGEFRALASEFVGPAPDAGVRIESDRHEAIRMAIRSAVAGDVVVLAGKGGSGTQRLGDAIVPWDERRHAREALVSRGYVGGEF